MTYLRLFFEFFNAGLFAIGGGLATLPFLYDIADKTGWYRHEQLADMIAVSESTPGPIGINMATYVGFHVGGAVGALVATIGVVTPSVIIIVIVSKFLKRFSENRYVKGAFYGLRAASVALIAAACFLVVKISILNIPLFHQSGKLSDLFRPEALILSVTLFFLMRRVKWHPVFFLCLSAIAGIVFHFSGV